MSVPCFSTANWDSGGGQPVPTMDDHHHQPLANQLARVALCVSTGLRNMLKLRWMHGTPVKYRFSPSWTAVSRLIFSIENRPRSHQ